METRRSRSLLKSLLTSAALFAAALPNAWAVPSYARQTAMACSTCHTVFPELTPFGREFKLNGYVLDNMKQIKGITIGRSETMSLNQIPPLSLMGQISYTHTSQALPDTGPGAPTGALAKDGEVSFPQQVSFFYAGKIADSLGAFVQLTYSGPTDHFGLDNTDVRYVQHTSFAGPEQDVIFGVTLNNNPTVQDPWNTTSAWGYPFAGSFTAPTPNTSTKLDSGAGGIGQNVGGLGGYMWFDHSIYAEVTLYSGAKVGGTHPLDSNQKQVVHGIAPYWRLAYERRWDQNSLSVGTFGIRAGIHPGGNNGVAAPGTVSFPLSGPTDRYTDYGLDTQYQYISDDHQVSALATYYHEHRDLAASVADGLAQKVDGSLNTEKLGVNYYYRRKIGGSVGIFNTTGSSDNIQYAAAPVVGSATNSPSSRGYVFELNYLPALNVKLQVQYVAYSKFNGASSNYDGSGRSASDNNTLYLLGWFNF